MDKKKSTATMETLEQRDRALERLWEELGDVPMDPDTERMEVPFLHFPAGIDREDIWHWFDERYSKGVACLLYSGTEERALKQCPGCESEHCAGSQKDSTGKKCLERAIGAMIEKGVIRFEAFSWCFHMVDMTVYSEVFTDTEFTMSVPEDSWNDGPAKAVAAELAQIVLKGSIAFVPCTERT